MSAGLRWLIHATGMRFLLRRKAAFAAAALTIALAVAANTAAFSVVKAFLLSGLGVPEPDRLMLIANMRAIHETLASGRVTNETSREYAEMGIREATRLTRLVDNLLAYARITDVAHAYAFEPVAIEERHGRHSVFR